MDIFTPYKNRKRHLTTESSLLTPIPHFFRHATSKSTHYIDWISVKKKCLIIIYWKKSIQKPRQAAMFIDFFKKNKKIFSKTLDSCSKLCYNWYDVEDMLISEPSFDRTIELPIAAYLCLYVIRVRDEDGSFCFTDYRRATTPPSFEKVGWHAYSPSLLS